MGIAICRDETQVCHIGTACPVWSTSLPNYLSDAIEMIQKRVLRSIYPGLHYDEILVLVGLQSLKNRRDNFNRLKCNTHRLNHLIPERRNVHYTLRNANVYPIPVTRTDRYKNVIVPWGLCNWQYVYLSAKLCELSMVVNGIY